MTMYNDRHHPRDREAAMAQSMKESLVRASNLAGIKPTSVKLVTELGGGTGKDSRAILEVYPNAQVQVISYEDERDDDLKTDPRIIFFHGEFVEVLGSGKIEPGDVVVLKDAGPEHGFNQSNIGLLAGAVGEGILITEGDISGLINDWFYQQFRLVVPAEKIYGFSVLGAGVWRVK